MASPSAAKRAVPSAPAAPKGALRLARMADPGPEPDVLKLPVDRLHVDLSYQRNLGRDGENHARNIARDFTWARFGTIVVCLREDGTGYNVIDGQHRVAAAKLRGDIANVPAMVVSPDRPLDTKSQAALFVSLNSDRIAVRPIHVFWANVASGEADACRVAALCKRSGVRIAHFQGIHKEPATTSAIKALSLAIKIHGEENVTTSLEALRSAQARGAAHAGDVDGLLMGGNAIRAVTEFVAKRSSVSVARLARAILAQGGMDEFIDAGRARRRKQDLGGSVWTPMADILARAYDKMPRVV